MAAVLLIVAMALFYLGFGNALGEAHIDHLALVASADPASVPADLRVSAAVWRDFAADFQPAAEAVQSELAARGGSYVSAFEWNVGVTNGMLFVESGLLGAGRRRDATGKSVSRCSRKPCRAGRNGSWDASARRCEKVAFWHDGLTMLAIRGEHPVEAGEVESWAKHGEEKPDNPLAPMTWMQRLKRAADCARHLVSVHRQTNRRPDNQERDVEGRRPISL